MKTPTIFYILSALFFLLLLQCTAYPSVHSVEELTDALITRTTEESPEALTPLFFETCECNSPDYYILIETKEELSEFITSSFLPAFKLSSLYTTGEYQTARGNEFIIIHAGDARQTFDLYVVTNTWQIFRIDFY